MAMATPSISAIEAAERRGRVNYRRVVVPKPEILPACKNCRHFTYDSDDRLNFRGEITFRKTRLRCAVLDVPVTNNCVCDSHDFCHADRRDR